MSDSCEKVTEGDGKQIIIALKAYILASCQENNEVVDVVDW